MGDRVYVNITTSRRNSEAIIEEIGDIFDTVDQNEDTIEMICDEANYAFNDELTKLALEGWDFYGYHSVGETFPAGAFASLKGKIKWVDMVEGYLVVKAYPESGNILKKSLNDVQAYVKYRKALELKYFGGYQS